MSLFQPFADAPRGAAPPATAFIGLGANLGEPRAALAAALAQLDRHPALQLQRVSSLYRTQPLDAAGPDFLNAVAMLQTALTPLQLLDCLQAIEQAAGRERPYRNAPRTLDLDLLLYDQLRCDMPRLTLPHPRAHQRLFVLVPLVEIAPEIRIPGQGRAVDLAAALDAQGIETLAAPAWWRTGDASSR